MVSGTPGTQPPSSSWEQHNLPHAHTVPAPLQPPPPPSTMDPNPRWVGGRIEDCLTKKRQTIV